MPAGASAGRAEFLREPVQVEGEGIVNVLTFVYTAGPGEVNDVRVSADYGPVYFLQDAAGVTLGRSCSRPAQGDTTRAVCREPGPGGGNVAHVRLGDRADTAIVAPGGPIIFDVDGGSGNDTLTGFDLKGGPGDDRLASWPGARAEFDESDPNNGSDTIRGGAPARSRRASTAAVIVDYGGRNAPVRASLDDRRNDGEAGENDQLLGVNWIEGGRAPDRLTGGRGDDQLEGGGGPDRLKGGAGDDWISATTLVGPGRRRTRDRLDGGRGNDVIEGSPGANRVLPGAGQDDLTLYGGRDQLNSRDRSVDVVRCGRGRDRAKADFRDFATRCERVRRNRTPGAIPLEETAFLDPGYGVFVRVGCPEDGPRVCRGSATIVHRGRRRARQRFRIRRGRSTYLDFGRRLLDKIGNQRARIVVRSRDRRGHRRKVVLRVVIETGE
jgi:serralysin